MPSLKKTFTPDRLRPAVVLNLDDPEDLALVNGTSKWAPGLIPGEPNEGLVAGKFIEAPPRLADFDDSSWETPENVRDVVGTGLHLRLVPFHDYAAGVGERGGGGGRADMV